MQTHTFIGVDLAWSPRNPSGFAVAEGDDRQAVLSELTSIAQSFEESADWIAERATTEHVVVAIDAPLIVANETGMRPCERELTAVFGSAWAGTHSSNRGTFRDGGPPRLAAELALRGFRHAVDPDQLSRPGRWMIEVYPHPAIVRLFGLEKRLPYKKGLPEVKTRGLQWLLHALVALQAAKPASTAPEPMVPNVVLASKALEDRLDAWLCAYIAQFACHWGAARTRVFGDEATGYIVVPKTNLGLSLDAVPDPLDLTEGTDVSDVTIETDTKTLRTSRSRARSSGATTVPGYVNGRRQRVIAATGLPGNLAGQSTYELECGDCGLRYGANGCDIHGRCCPQCQRGQPGLPLPH